MKWPNLKWGAPSYVMIYSYFDSTYNLIETGAGSYDAGVAVIFWASMYLG